MVRNPNSDSAIGKIITDWLGKNNHSQAWLATKADITSIHMNRVIKGAVKPSYKLIEKISEVINIDADVLFDLSNK